jgi:hypothetical protein
VGIFSKNLSGYFAAFRTGILALVVVGVIRMLLQPVGIPISVAGPVISITICLIICMLAYGYGIGSRGESWGDVLALSLVLVVVYTVVDAFGVAASASLGIDTYFTDPQHVGSDLQVGQHVMNHVIAFPIFVAVSFILGLMGWGVGKVLAGRR